MNKLTSIFIGFLLVIGFTTSSYSRDQIKIVGSSTVYPYATVVAEKFGKSGKFKTPVIESTGTGGGMKLFCAGVGEEAGPFQSLAKLENELEELEEAMRRAAGALEFE